jgi:hypothetical protein
MRESRALLARWHDFLEVSHSVVMNQYSALTVSKAVRPKKREIPTAEQYFTAVFGNSVHDALFMPLLIAVLNIVPPDKVSFERELTTARQNIVNRGPRTPWIEKEVLATFRCPLGWRIAKVLSIVQLFETAFPDDYEDRLSALFSALPSHELLETITHFKHHISTNAAIRGKLPPAVDILDRQFAIVCKPVPRLYFWYTAKGR